MVGVGANENEISSLCALAILHIALRLPQSHEQSIPTDSFLRQYALEAAAVPIPTPLEKSHTNSHLFQTDIPHDRDPTSPIYYTNQ